MSKPITYTHENGYSATLYGESSMTVYHYNVEVLHTGMRKPNTEAEVMEFLEEVPKFMEMFKVV